MSEVDPTDFHWRNLAQAGDWGNIDPLRLDENERAELRSMLEEIVPKVIKGHGIELFEAHINPDEAGDLNQYLAASLLSYLKQIAPITFKEYFSEIDKAVNSAKEIILKELNVDFEGLQDTYLYKDEAGNYRQIRSDIGSALKAKREGMIFQDYADMNAARNSILRWTSLYPWRSADTLKEFWRREAFSPNSPLDHALHILNWHSLFNVDLDASSESDEQSAFESHFIAKAAYWIGRHQEALIRKSVDVYAEKKITEVYKNRANGQKGGQASRKAERYTVLDKLAQDNVAKFELAKDAEWIRIARRLAESYDKGASELLFAGPHGKPLTREWFSEWASHFRQKLLR